MITKPKPWIPRRIYVYFVLTLLGVSLTITATYWPLQWIPSDSRALVTLSYGGMAASFAAPGDFELLGSGFEWMDVWQNYWEWWPRLSTGDSTVSDSRGTRKFPTTSIRIPLYLPTLFFAALTSVTFIRVWRRRPRPRCCTKCNYDLTGNLSGICPECGNSCAAESGPAAG